MSKSDTPRMARRDFLVAAAAGALAGTGGAITPARPGQEKAKPILKSEDLQMLVVSDGHFVLPTGFLVAPEVPKSESEAALKAAGFRDVDCFWKELRRALVGGYA